MSTDTSRFLDIRQHHDQSLRIGSHNTFTCAHFCATVTPGSGTWEGAWGGEGGGGGGLKREESKKELHTKLALAESCHSGKLHEALRLMVQQASVVAGIVQLWHEINH